MGLFKKVSCDDCGDSLGKDVTPAEVIKAADKHGQAKHGTESANIRVSGRRK